VSVPFGCLAQLGRLALRRLFVVVFVSFRCEKILDFDTVVFSFVCGKYYPIID